MLRWYDAIKNMWKLLRGKQLFLLNYINNEWIYPKQKLNFTTLVTISTTFLVEDNSDNNDCKESAATYSAPLGVTLFLSV